MGLDPERSRQIGVIFEGWSQVLYHSDLGEQITTRVAALRPAPLQVNVNHDLEMDADLFDGAVHLFRDGLEGTRFEDRLSRRIPPVSDVRSRLEAAGFLDGRRGEMGDFKTVSATFSEGRTGPDQEYLEAIVAILRRSPTHMHMFVGSGDRRSVRSYLHSCDVLRQVRFLGQSTDAVTYLPMIDAYIASFPDADAQSIVEAMGAGKPAVVRSYAPGSRHNRGAELVGTEEMVASGFRELVDMVRHVIEDEDYRYALGQSAAERFLTEFTPARLGLDYLDFLTLLL